MTYLYPFLIEIPKPSQQCCRNKEPLAGLEYHTVLFENPEKEGLLREDYCKECWELVKADRQKIVSHWKARMPGKAAVVKPKNDVGPLLDRLKVLLEEPSELNQGKAYLLALFLVRARKFATRQEITVQQEKHLIFENLETGETFCMRKISAKELAKPELAEALN